MGKVLKGYTKEYKQEVVNLALKWKSISGTTKELGIPCATLLCAKGGLV